MKSPGYWRGWLLWLAGAPVILWLSALLVWPWWGTAGVSFAWGMTSGRIAEWAFAHPDADQETA